MSEEQRIYTLKEIAAELKIDKQRVYRFVKQNRISEVHREANSTKNGVKYYDEAAKQIIRTAFDAVCDSSRDVICKSDVNESDVLHAPVKHSDASRDVICKSDMNESDVHHAPVKHSDASCDVICKSNMNENDVLHTPVKHSDSSRDVLCKSGMNESDVLHAPVKHSDSSCDVICKSDVNESDVLHAPVKHSDSNRDVICKSNMNESDVLHVRDVICKSDMNESEVHHAREEIEFLRRQILDMNERMASRDAQIRQQGDVIVSLNRELEKEREHNREKDRQLMDTLSKLAEAQAATAVGQSAEKQKALVESLVEGQQSADAYSEATADEPTPEVVSRKGSWLRRLRSVFSRK